MKIVSVVGARPEFVQAALLSRELSKHHKEILVHTGQHYDDAMSQVFFRDLDLRVPDYNLGVGSASHAEQTAEILVKFEQVLKTESPDWVIVRGDTNSTLGAALAAAKLNIPIAHVEAGMRSYNRAMPEEINRVLTDHLSAQFFCPTPSSVANLAREGLTHGAHCVGDVMYDTLLRYSPLADEKTNLLRQLELSPKSYWLATVHRSGNTDDVNNLRQIIAAFNALGETIVFPVHPRTRRVLNELNLPVNSHVRLIDPVGYLDMLALEKNARRIITDSGGVQREAYFLEIPCITLRDETEWTETVEDGLNILVGANTKKIVDAVLHFSPALKSSKRLGDGTAVRKIVEVINNQR